MKTMYLALVGGLLVTSLAPAWAGTAEVIWQEPKNYRDVQAGEELQSRFQERVFKEFEKHFNELAAKLPEQQILKVTVTDVDLAGHVEPRPIGGSLQMLRIVNSSDFPAMSFSYEIVDATGAVIASGEEKLRGRDLPGQGRVHNQANSPHELLDYERAMLDRWFRLRFETELK